MVLEQWGWVVQSSLWLLLGDASFSIYLTDPFVTQMVQKAGQRLGAQGFFAIALVAVAVTCSCALGVLLHWMVELPLWAYSSSGA